jgi:hypothetical protein
MSDRLLLGADAANPVPPAPQPDAQAVPAAHFGAGLRAAVVPRVAGLLSRVLLLRPVFEPGRQFDAGGGLSDEIIAAALFAVIWELGACSLSKVFSVQGGPTSQDGADYYLLWISLRCFSAGPYRLTASFGASRRLCLLPV